MKRRSKHRPRKLHADILEMGQPIRIREAPADGALGYFDPRTGTIHVDPALPWEGKNVILLHELLHLVAEMLVQSGAIRRQPDHAFIEAAAPTLLYLLVAAGAWNGLDRAELRRWLMTKERPKPRRKR